MDAGVDASKNPPFWTDATKIREESFIMLAGCLLLGFTVIVVAIWLEYNDSLGWPNEIERERNALTTRDDRYRIVRRRWRRIVHGLIALCGALMISAGLAGLGQFWIAAWTAVAILMLSIIVIAIGDAIRTHRHYAAKLREQKSRGDLSR